ncbi:MAG: peptidase M20 [Desulfobacterales bacterium]|nr:MAG: peptidase M20 [Desulfobacterales bacterium]
MKNIVNRERLARFFTELCEISSPSREEKDVSEYLKSFFTGLGADSVYEDDSASVTGSNCGNLVVRFDGTTDREPVFFACHMDTVSPGKNIKVVRTGDIFTSEGATVLGGDDKSGIASIMELIFLLKEQQKPHRTLELIFTTCEEIGLNGAKAFDPALVRSTFGYALDASGRGKVIIGAPAANKFAIDLYGTAAHAGLNPDAGVNAIQIAAEAISKLKLGRLDEQSTANLGVIEGGIATNIVPEHVLIKGEIRSHSSARLEAYTREMEQTFTETVENWPVVNPANKPSVTFSRQFDYPEMLLSDKAQVLMTLDRAGETLGRQITKVIGGGGSDANIFNSVGLSTAILATGMDKVHTIDERLDLQDISDLAMLLYAIARE